MGGKLKYLISGCLLFLTCSQDSNNALNSVKFLFSFLKRNDREEVTFCL